MTPGRPEVPLEAVVGAVAELVGRPVDPGDRLVADLGLDSLHLYELAVALDRLAPGVELPEHVPVDVLTVLDVAHLARRSATA